MLGRYPWSVVPFLLVVANLAACASGSIGGGGVDDGTGMGLGSSGGPGGPGGRGPGGGPGVDGGTGASTLLPARIRRLTNAEFDLSVKALLGIDSKFGASFTPDARQDGFTLNDAQQVDPVFASQLDTAAQQLAAQARMNVAKLAPCASTDPKAGEACARTFLSTFAARAYRRPPAQREIDALISVYHAGADGMTYADGIEPVVQAVLESPAFLYVTEIGDGAAKPLTALAPYEAASALSYLFTSGPPDDALLAAAAAGELATADGRTKQARRLLALPGAADQVTRVVEDWLGIENIADTAKDTTKYPTFAGLRDSMKSEADAFIKQVMWTSKGTVSDLLSADWTIASASLATAYGAGAPGADGRVHLTNRRGILNQGAFLSVYSRAQETAPVLRGVALLRRVLCIDIPAPSSLGIVVVPPMPDPNKTTRQRFDIHGSSKTITKGTSCNTCHKNIDAFGFAFENFDAMGMVRAMDGTLPVDSTTTIGAGFDFAGSYPDSAALMAKMAMSPTVPNCFATHMLKFAAARSDATELGVEQGFLNIWQSLPAAAQGNLGEILVAWAGSDAFVQRRFVP